MMAQSSPLDLCNAHREIRIACDIAKLNLRTCMACVYICRPYDSYDMSSASICRYWIYKYFYIIINPYISDSQ